VVGDVAELVEMPERDAAPRLLLVEKGFESGARLARILFLGL